jgi:hypothetical protein
MNAFIFDPFQLREIFHLEFLRRLGGKLSPKSYALKGGVNMRFFSEASASPRTWTWTSRLPTSIG